MNRKIPPLRYDYVYQLIQDFPLLKFTLNGGINTLQDAKQQLEKGVHGVMIGRSIINTPYHYRNTDSIIYNKQDPG